MATSCKVSSPAQVVRVSRCAMRAAPRRSSRPGKLARAASRLSRPRRAGADGAKAEQVCQQRAIRFGSFLVEVAGQRDADLFLLCPCLLRERAVHAHADHFGVHALIRVESRGDVAHFFGADAGESEREEQEHGVLLAEIVAELYVHQTGSLLRFETEIWCFGTN